MNMFSNSNFSFIEGDSSIVILDAKDIPLVVFPFCNRDPDFVMFYAIQLIPAIEAGFFSISIDCPERFKRRLSLLRGEDLCRLRLSVVSNFEKTFK